MASTPICCAVSPGAALPYFLKQGNNDATVASLLTLQIRPFSIRKAHPNVALWRCLGQLQGR
jgi:hypothetical protein